MDQVSNDIKKTYTSLESVFRNQHYQHTREETHRQSNHPINNQSLYKYFYFLDIGSLENKVKWSAFIKVIVLMLIALGQVYVLTSFFRNRKDLPV